MRFLLLADYDPGNASVIGDFMYAFDRYSEHEFYYAFWPRHLEPEFNFDDFDAIVVFWSVTLAPKAPIQPTFSPELRERIRRSSARKIVFLQDEYRAIRNVNQEMAELGVNIVFSCVAEKDHSFFYPKSIIATLGEVHTVLTGYVPAYLEKPEVRNVGARSFDIGYRSRDVAYQLGDLAREKRRICDIFLHEAPRRGFSINASVREDDRIYGADWVTFLQQSRYQIGTPSGASVMDLDGSVERKISAYLNRHPRVSYEVVKQKFFASIDGTRPVIECISPRVFECAATGAAMANLEGQYSDAIEPGRRLHRDQARLHQSRRRLRANAGRRSAPTHG